MKVCLFVQTGDGRPKCFAATEALVSREWVEGDGSRFVDSHLTLEAKVNSDRWWLVECENADEGRKVIQVHPAHVYQDTRLLGRILASGGKPCGRQARGGRSSASALSRHLASGGKP